MIVESPCACDDSLVSVADLEVRFAEIPEPALFAIGLRCAAV